LDHDAFNKRVKYDLIKGIRLVKRYKLFLNFLHAKILILLVSQQAIASLEMCLYSIQI